MNDDSVVHVVRQGHARMGRGAESGKRAWDGECETACGGAGAHGESVHGRGRVRQRELSMYLPRQRAARESVFEAGRRPLAAKHAPGSAVGRRGRATGAGRVC